jgi:hypothetical protein
MSGNTGCVDDNIELVKEKKTIIKEELSKYKNSIRKLLIISKF